MISLNITYDIASVDGIAVVKIAFDCIADVEDIDVADDIAADVITLVLIISLLLPVKLIFGQLFRI